MPIVGEANTRSPPLDAPDRPALTTAPRPAERTLPLQRFTLLVAAACASLALAATAHAARPPVDATTSRTVQRSLTIAEKHFGEANRCDGPTTIVYSWTLSRRYNAFASWWPCHIQLQARRSFSRVQTCTLIVHEYGHLAGHGHTRHGLMRSHTLSGGYIYGPCRSA